MDIFQALLIANSGKDPFKDVFAFTIDTTKGGSLTFQIPFVTNRTYVNPIEVDWGDGNVQTYTNGINLPHTYTTHGSYQIKVKAIDGEYMPQWRTEIGSTPAKFITSIDSPFLNMQGNMGSVTDLIQLFQNTINMTSVCEKLLSKNTFCTNVANMFYRSAIQSVPSDLFAYCPDILSFSSIFYECDKLVNIPAGLFANNAKATTFYRCFWHNFALESVPNNLFRENRKAIDFSSCFEECKKLQINRNIMCNDASERATRFADVTSSVNLNYMFYRTTFTGVQGTAPELWNYTFPKGKSATGVFATAGGNNTSSISNYNDIPSEWK